MDDGLLSLQWNNHQSAFLQVLSLIHRKDLYADVTLACDGKFYESHKIVLSTCSEYFKEMFHITEGKHPIIVLKDICSDDLECLLKYMYLGEVNVLQTKLPSLVKSAESLKIKGLATPDDEQFKKKKRKQDSDIRPSLKKLKSSICDADNDRSNIPYRLDCHNEPENITAINDDTNMIPVLKHIKQEPSEVINIDNIKEEIFHITEENFNNVPTNLNGPHNPGLQINQDNNVWIPVPSEPKTDNENDDTLNYGFDPLVSNSDGMASNVDNDKSTISEYCFANDIEMQSSMAPRDKKTYGYHSCEKCNKVFDHKGNFKKHMMVHEGEKPHKCHFCNYSAAQKGNVVNHMKRIHQAVINENRYRN